MNWNPVICKYMNGQGNPVYQTGYVAPRSGEIVIFDNVGSLTITYYGSISIGDLPYTDYSEIVNGCTYGGGTIHSLQIINSNINFSGIIIHAGGNGTSNAGYAEGLRLQNSTLTCKSLSSGNGASGSTPPLLMNCIYADNSTINCTGLQSDFNTSGNTYFTNCTINSPQFNPNSNNDHPNEKDEFIGCTINVGRVGFGGKCIAIATNCTFNLAGAVGFGPNFVMNWSATQNSVTLNNIQINIIAAATGSSYIAFGPGASVINGNINFNITYTNF
jgi:hypothetical protein